MHPERQFPKNPGPPGRPVTPSGAIRVIRSIRRIRMKLRLGGQIGRLVGASALVLCACNGENTSASSSSTPLFELLAPKSTGVSFVNQLPEKPDFNILNYLY